MRQNGKGGQLVKLMVMADAPGDIWKAEHRWAGLWLNPGNEQHPVPRHMTTITPEGHSFFLFV